MLDSIHVAADGCKVACSRARVAPAPRAGVASAQHLLRSRIRARVARRVYICLHVQYRDENQAIPWLARRILRSFAPAQRTAHARWLGASDAVASVGAPRRVT